ncbi:glycosyltransferase [Blastopirellula retiformator]|uniref:N, N'-diacetylbacillosaminyl-diphospho-undecaprenol alpha-1,3-N-acetylgalactosaminyltransferase n=1 Tax=Blastopirellula retiformator TaxID=2527970 RepID=A0A5C5UVA9_9BACT|nr:glycosyltransferase [Blastopirellula retiformator]TWT30108.1 N,N'-diacetylbacillosaminyl-diphospho-undecaprenol alpha-1,3-N-acetylgalactosaminyltransferase [Blastopirellula retiformator]
MDGHTGSHSTDISSSAYVPPVSKSAAAPQTETGLKKVLHLINGEHYSGAERVQDLLGLRLPEFGYHADFACVKPGKFATSRRAQDCQVFELAMRHRFDLWRSRDVVRLVQEHGYKIIHAHTPRTALLAMLAARSCDAQFVYHVHSPTSRDSTRRFTNWVNQQVESWAMFQAARLITVSNSLSRHLASLHVPAEKVRVVHNGVPPLEEVPAREASQGTWTVGCVALFRPRKGIEVLLQALANLRSAGHDVRLRAVGPFETPEYEREIMALVAKLDLQAAIDWVGFTQDVNAELFQMDLFVLPSLFGEGLPMVVLEAMAAGVPVIASDVEGACEAIQSGVDGLLAIPADADDLTQKISSVVSGQVDWLSLRQAALLRQREAFSDRSMASGTAAVYDELLG